MQDYVQQLVEYWIGYKIRLLDAVGLTNDAMHIHGSLLILFGSAIILRRRPDSVWCWLIVLVADPTVATVLSEFASMTDHVTVRLVLVAVGSSEVDR